MQNAIPYSQIRRIHFKLARQNLWHYCKLKAPNFYNENTPYLKEICDSLQDFENDDNELLVINLPPRFGKTRTAGLAVQWYFGRNKNLKIITASYNEKLSRKFSKAARNDISERKSDKSRIVFSDIFPTVKIQKGSAAVDLWKLEGSDTDNYLATAPSATVTGIGGDIIVVDDIVKNAYEANNADILENHFTWFTDTMYSRLEGKRKVILIMTRWATKDLAGRLIEMYQSQNRKIKLITKKAFDGVKMLNESILSKEQYDLLIQTIGEDIVRANYDQEPIDLKGKLYGEFLTYSVTPEFVRIESICDTADSGSDYLCNIIYGVTKEKKAYVLDVYYTKDNMDITEKELAKRITEHKVNVAVFESNFGGRAFRKVIESVAKSLGNDFTSFRTFTQTLNKEARILSNSTNVIRQVLFPEQWNKLFPKFYQDLTEYQREGKNKNDDACFIAGTMITTTKGNKPIELVKVGDKVITPFGERKVISSGLTGIKKVIKNIGLVGTPNHKIFVKNEYKPLDSLTMMSECDIISLKELMLWRYKKLLCSTESNINLWGRKNIILVNQKIIKDGKILKDSMLQFGNFITAKQYLKAIAFTIKMAILLITTLKIWSAFQLGNICQAIQRKTTKTKNTVKKMLKILKKYVQRQVNGIVQKKEKYGIVKTQKNNGKIKNISQENAIVAEKNTKQEIINHNSVAKPADSVIDGKISVSYTEEYVKYVETHLKPKYQKTQVINQEQRAINHARASEPMQTEQKVYNITVDKDGVYYANNILVSNCDTMTMIVERLKMQYESLT